MNARWRSIVLFFAIGVASLLLAIAPFAEDSYLSMYGIERYARGLLMLLGLFCLAVIAAHDSEPDDLP